ncbi:MAG: 3-dehydroquinate synthase [Chloroflexia bacterium]|nr:3-dehydroquinate synthase [Chloroflexia bacterium]
MLADSNTINHCFPVIKTTLPKNIPVFVLEAGEEYKHIESVVKVWEFLNSNGADRKSVVINLGGGVLCDLGGFAASTFKRGLDFIHIPTTLLSQVDASVGGKTGVNFKSFKNEIGSFSFPMKVIIDSCFTKTLPLEHILSGFGEMLKHAFIKDEKYYYALKNLDLDLENLDYNKILSLVQHSVKIKEEVVLLDPMEKGLRKILNFGHTIGHAFESYYLGSEKELIHGKAVAYGMIMEMYLSHIKLDFPKDKLIEVADYLNKVYGKLLFGHDDYEKLFSLMTHDKKNENHQVNFTLLKDIGQSVIDETASKKEIFEAFDFYLYE